MEALGKYILSVTAAAILFGILQSFISSKSSCGVLLKLIGGLFLTFTIITPIADVNIDALFDTSWDFTVQGTAAAAQGQEIAQEEFQGIIKQKCEAYILDKAEAYHAQLEVEVTLNQDDMPIPTAVRLQGSVSPYTKTSLQQWLEEDMGIPKENQVWIG